MAADDGDGLPNLLALSDGQVFEPDLDAGDELPDPGDFLLGRDCFGACPLVDLGGREDSFGSPRESSAGSRVQDSAGNLEEFRGIYTGNVQTYRLRAVAFTWLVNSRHASVLKLRTGPARSLVSRTRTPSRTATDCSMPAARHRQWYTSRRVTIRYEFV